MSTSVTIRQSLVLITVLGLPTVAMLSRQDHPTSDSTPTATVSATPNRLAATDQNSARDALEPSSQQALAEVRQALRDLGATYQRLERWRGETVRYHFQCEIIAPGATQLERFEALAATDLEAMRQVWRDAQRWHANHVGATTPVSATNLPSVLAWTDPGSPE